MEAFDIPSSPTAAFGKIVLLLAFVLAGYTLAVGVIGSRQRRPRLIRASMLGLWAFTGLMTLASALIIYAFVTHDFTIKYVAHYSDTTMPLWYKITAYWGGLDGSLMFWVFVLAMFASIAVFVNRERHRDMMGYVVATIMGVCLFFLALLVYDKNPFNTFLTDPPVDGKGLNPLLQNYWMVIHPPSLYIGFVAATVPFAFCVGALASGRLDDSWIYSIRVWVFVCFFFLSFGLILGGRWAYEELGWGGYWAWDPVENAGFLPWFTATAVLHSIIIQEQRGSMKVWNVVLCILTFFLTIFGTFMTRSGVVQSVHAFGEDNRLALLFILFMAVIWIFSVGLLVYRLPRLRSKGSFDSFVSREFAFLLNNWVLLGCALFVLFATMFPTISEAVRGHRVTVGPPFFNKWMVPLGLSLLFLAGAAPLLAWRRTTVDRLWNQFLFPVAVSVLTVGILALAFPRTRELSPIFSNKLQFPSALTCFGIVAFTLSSCLQEFWKGMRVRRRQTGSDPITSLLGIVLAKRRRYGGYLIHMGVAVMFIGFAGKAFDTEQDFTLHHPGTTSALIHDEENPLPYAAALQKCAAGELPDCVFVRGFMIRYDRFIRCPDVDGDPFCKDVNGDHKTTWTARMWVTTKEGAAVGRMEPARWRYAKLPDQPTTEPAIDAHGLDDVYIALLGFEEGKDAVANFRVFLNPLINWVWLGFVLLMLGTVVCLVPESVVKRLKPAPKTRVGRFADKTALILFVGLSTLISVNAARAEQTPAGGGGAAGPVYEDTNPMAGPSAAHLYRPDSDVAKTLMSELGCMCGGCAKEAILSCKCGFAAEERGQVLAMLEGRDLSTDAARERAYLDVRDAFIAKHGEEVLILPIDEGFNRLAWAIPFAALGGALVLMFGFGRYWVRRGRRDWADNLAQAEDVDLDDEAADILDDELSKID
jgi:cytochrome c-type biogenesis protein CcmF